MDTRNERVVIFIDGNNLYFTIRRMNKNPMIDFNKFIKCLVNNRTLIRTYYYNAPVDPDNKEQYEKQQLFLEKLRRNNYFEIVLGRLEKRTTDINWDIFRNKLGPKLTSIISRKMGQKIEYYVEKGVDVNIAVDMLELAYRNTYDTGILVSNDGDFVRAIKAVKDLGKHVEVATVKKYFSYHLANICDKRIYIDKFI
jgi:uncharacterized LabA/DUF88 family protein